MFYSYGTKHTKQSTNVKIPRGAWNDKRKEIDIDNYPFLIEQQKTLLNIWKNKFEMTDKLKSGKISICSEEEFGGVSVYLFLQMWAHFLTAPTTAPP